MKLNRAEVGGSSGWFGQPFVDSAIRLALLSVLALAFAHGGAIAKGPQPALEATHFDSRYRLELLHPVQDKNFYLLSLLQRERALRLAIQQDDTLQRLAAERRSAQKRALGCRGLDSMSSELNRRQPFPKRIAAPIAAVPKGPGAPRA